MLQKKQVLLLRPLNAPYFIALHVAGKHHTIKHRILCGMPIMVIGVYIAHLHVNLILSIVCDTFGYCLHGIGMIPIGEYFLNLKRAKQ